MKQLLVLAFVGAFVFVACGGGGDSDDPTGVVKEVVSAMESLDVEKASEFFCEEQKDELQGSMESGFEELAAMGMNPDELLDAIKINFKDLKYDEKSKDGDRAVVHVSGSMSLDFDKEKFRSFIKEALEASGQTVTDQELDFVLNIFDGMAGQELPVDGDIQVVKEGGEWAVCDDLDFLDSSELFELPFP